MNKQFMILIFAVVSLGLAKIIKSIASKYNIFLFILIYALAGSIMMSLIRKKKPYPKKIEKRSIRWGLLIGLVQTAAVFSILWALRIGDTSRTFPLNSLNIIPVMVFSWVFYKERVSWKGFLGIIIGIAAILLLK